MAIWPSMAAMALPTSIRAYSRYSELRNIVERLALAQGVVGVGDRDRGPGQDAS